MVSFFFVVVVLFFFLNLNVSDIDMVSEPDTELEGWTPLNPQKAISVHLDVLLSVRKTLHHLSKRLLQFDLSLIWMVEHGSRQYP